jgi:hypothetical protein
MELGLYSGETRLGTLTFSEIDWPRYYFRFQPSPAYAAFRDAMEIHGQRVVPKGYMERVDKLDLRVVDKDGRSEKYRCVFIDGDRAIIREGHVRREPDSGTKIVGG